MIRKSNRSFAFQLEASHFTVIGPPNSPELKGSKMSDKQNRNLEVFNNPEFGQMRILNEDGKYLFCASDAATALGYSNPRSALQRHCKGVPEPEKSDEFFTFFTEYTPTKAIRNKVAIMLIICPIDRVICLPPFPMIHFQNRLQQNISINSFCCSLFEF